MSQLPNPFDKTREGRENDGQYVYKQKFLRESEARERLGVTYIRLKKLCEQGKIPYTMFGKQRKFDEDEIDAYIKSTRRPIKTNKMRAEEWKSYPI